MHSHYIYAPPARYEGKWHFGWNSCLLFLASLLLLALYAVLPAVSLKWVLIAFTTVTVLGVLCALYSIIFSQFWLSKTYATCGLLGNLCVMIWVLLSL